MQDIPKSPIPPKNAAQPDLRATAVFSLEILGVNNKAGDFCFNSIVFPYIHSASADPKAELF